MFRFLTSLLRPVLALLTAALLASCGGGNGTVVVPFPTRDSLRPLSAEFTNRKAVNYSPYRTARDNAGLAAEVIPEANIKQDLDLLGAAGFGLIRLFDSSDKVAGQTLAVIRKHNLNIKVQLGIYLQVGNDAFTQGEITRGIALAQQYSDIILAVSVGNETQIYWTSNPIKPDVMASALDTVRKSITQPITTDDNWAYFAGNGADARVLGLIDFASIHTYPEIDTQFELWDWRLKDVPAAARAATMMDGAIAAAKTQYALARNYLDTHNLSALPITIGETGWNAVDNSGLLKFRASPVNQKMYYDRLRAWAAEGKAGAGPKAIFYFEAFDEPWKQSDNGWGLFNVNRQARYVIQGLNPPSASWVYEPGNYTDANAVSYVPPVIGAAVTESKYTLYSEAPLAASEKRETWFGSVRMDAFGPGTRYPEVSTTAAPGDGASSIAVQPNPENYGWGLLIQSNPSGQSINLSNFANGNINFRVNTSYAGKIEVGLITESAEFGTQEAFIQIANGQYGYCNTAAWCQVSVPVQAFVTANPKIDLRMVLSRFVIADRFAFTKNTQTSGLPGIALDGIYWSK